MQKHKVTVTEKLDLIYFKVMINESGICVLNSKNKPINDIDCIVNSVYNDIINFVNNRIKSKYDILYNEFGNCDAGFFYKPVPKTQTIVYYNCPYDFILNSLFTAIKSQKNINRFSEIIECVRLTPICEKECICKFDDINDSLDIVKKMTDNETWSGNSIEDIEGIILSCGKLTYKITINDVTSKIEKTTKKLYRDAILENFSRVISYDDIDIIAKQDKTYIEKICDLFMLYINSTNILTRLYIEDEDLLPPITGYIGDINYESLPSTVRLICKQSSFYKNILRILLITFNRSVFDNKFDSFDVTVKDMLNYTLSEINRESNKQN